MKYISMKYVLIVIIIEMILKDIKKWQRQRQSIIVEKNARRYIHRTFRTVAARASRLVMFSVSE